MVYLFTPNFFIHKEKDMPNKNIKLFTPNDKLKIGTKAYTEQYYYWVDIYNNTINKKSPRFILTK